MSDEKGWVKWTRNGRLSIIVWTLTFGVWIGFKIARIPLEGLDTVFILISGVLAANLGISTVKPSPSARTQRDADRDGETNA
jgi:hypothetical protein